MPRAHQICGLMVPLTAFTEPSAKETLTMPGCRLVAVTAPSIAAPCKDAKGKFVKCPPKGPVKPVRCKAANGKFTKCEPKAAAAAPKRCRAANGRFTKC